MRAAAGLLLALALAAPLSAETVRSPPGCTALATLVYEDCSVSLVSSCASMPADHRVYELYRGGEVASRSVNEDGVFLLVAATRDLHRTFIFSIGLLEKVLTSGEGSEYQKSFTSETRRVDGTERRKGVMTVRHKGFEAHRLGDTQVRVLRLEVDGDVDDGTRVRSTRLLEFESGILLGLFGTEVLPDGNVRRFDHRAGTRVLPGDPGFGEVEEPPAGTCGAPS